MMLISDKKIKNNNMHKKSIQFQIIISNRLIIIIEFVFFLLEH